VSEFCIGTLPNAANLDIVKRSEDLGFTHHGVGDGPLLFSDPFAYLGAVARGTSTIKIGTYVVNPLTRIPAVLANAHATLNLMAPGRVFCGLGAANNATRSMGVRIARIKEIEAAVQQIQGLMAGERVPNEWLGVTKDVQFLTNPDHGWLNTKDPVPVWQAAGGPKSIKSGAKYADAIVYPTGSDPALIGLVRRKIDEACAEVGRDPKEVNLDGVTWFALRKKGDTVEDAMRDGFGNGAVISADTNVNLMKEHRDELGDEIVDFAFASAESYKPQEGDQPMDHLEVFRTHANGVIAQRHVELTTEYAANYFCLWGDYDQVAERVQGMRDAGCDIPSVIFVNPMNYDRDLEQLAKALYG
jgi:alkanesulfonate monooxygenase SsuD/methylene tetrahydromethanopterin reductase-like flavin-dependent oxidoreductase (luciferase family)